MTGPPQKKVLRGKTPRGTVPADAQFVFHVEPPTNTAIVEQSASAAPPNPSMTTPAQSRTLAVAAASSSVPSSVGAPTSPPLVARRPQARLPQQEIGRSSLAGVSDNSRLVALSKPRHAIAAPVLPQQQVGRSSSVAGRSSRAHVRSDGGSVAHAAAATAKAPVPSATAAASTPSSAAAVPIPTPDATALPTPASVTAPTPAAAAAHKAPTAAASAAAVKAAAGSGTLVKSASQALQSKSLAGNATAAAASAPAGACGGIGSSGILLPLEAISGSRASLSSMNSIASHQPNALRSRSFYSRTSFGGDARKIAAAEGSGAAGGQADGEARRQGAHERVLAAYRQVSLADASLPLSLRRSSSTMRPSAASSALMAAAAPPHTRRARTPAPGGSSSSSVHIANAASSALQPSRRRLSTTSLSGPGGGAAQAQLQRVLLVGDGSEAVLLGSAGERAGGRAGGRR